MAKEKSDRYTSSQALADDLKRYLSNQEIEAKGRRAVISQTDVNDLRQIQALADLALERFGRVDAWVNNAGGFASVPGAMSEWLDVTPAGWDAMLRLNLTAQVFGAQAAARAMRAKGNGGAILFLSSIDSLYAAPGGEGSRSGTVDSHAAHGDRHRSGGRAFPRFSRPRRPAGVARPSAGDP